MTFELQHPVPLLDEEITTSTWPLPTIKPWAPKSSIEQMCEEALEYLAWMLDMEVMRHTVEMGLP